MVHFRTIAPLVLLLAAAACDLPRDADGTLDRVRRGTVRVGVIANPPWVTDSADSVGGVESVLARAIAADVGARVEWVRHPAPELLQALGHRDVDLVIGGLTDALPWKREVAFTRPYYTDTLAVGVPPGGAPLRDVKGERVAVEAGDPAAAQLRRKDAVPVVVDDLASATGAVAAPVWRLATLGRVGSGVVLHEDNHVLAVAPGENAWLVRVERLLRERKSAVPAMLRSAAQ